MADPEENSIPDDSTDAVALESNEESTMINLTIRYLRWKPIPKDSHTISGDPDEKDLALIETVFFALESKKSNVINLKIKYLRWKLIPESALGNLTRQELKDAVKEKNKPRARPRRRNRMLEHQELQRHLLPPKRMDKKNPIINHLLPIG